jgi:SAM-dependent methyltransferase
MPVTSKQGGIRRVLDIPRVYSWFADLVGGDARAAYTREYIRPVPGQRIIDIGCGPADIVSELPPGVNYVGVDISPQYIDAARARFGDRASFHCRAISSELAASLPRFDIAMANGVLHHLDDAQAIDMLRLARALLADGGRLLTLDGCYVAGQSFVARMLLDLDRGKHVRAADAYMALATRAFREVVPHLRQDLLRIPYTHLILECRP